MLYACDRCDCTVFEEEAVCKICGCPDRREADHRGEVELALRLTAAGLTSEEALVEVMRLWAKEIVDESVKLVIKQALKDLSLDLETDSSA